MQRSEQISKHTRPDAWHSLRQLTNARIAIGRAGNAIPLEENLRFRADHAHARDAVYTPLDVALLAEGLKHFNLPVYQLYSRAKDRIEYLQRPDKGRLLRPDSATLLYSDSPLDLAFVLADGLSARAVQLYAVPVLNELLPTCSGRGYTVTPICIAEQGRVAIGDEIGMLLKARLSVVLIGERPGLSSPHSMGMYITYNPLAGLTDESRFCISNIHVNGGLSPAGAAAQAFQLIQTSLATQLSGVYARHHHQLH